ncbi:MAG: AAA family ATPase [Mariprofundus sp.]|nr:AAA family ATPase [Mariprofundus sp.]
MIKSIKVQNLLSFDSEGIDLELKPLNVLIGPNGSGKSNLVEVISLIQASPSDLTLPIRDVGGISDWLWKGVQTKPVASIDVTVGYPGYRKDLRHVLCFTEKGYRLSVEDECIENDSPDAGESDVYFYYRYEHNHPVLNVKQERRNLKREDVDSEQSILSQRKDPDQYPEITWLSSVYGKIKIYREWCFGRYASPRKPQKTDERHDFLTEDSTNLGLVLNSIRRYPEAKKKLLDSLQQLYEGITDYGVSIDAGHVQVFFEENGMNVPATRLSDGTLRYLSLLAVLCHPEPPSLICIEEPELGLHPDILSHLAELLIDASQRTQLIVTTHSETLVDALSDTPESVLVCEKENGATSIRRCEPNELKVWLEKYALGELWRRGGIGGNRW